MQPLTHRLTIIVMGITSGDQSSCVLKHVSCARRSPSITSSLSLKHLSFIMTLCHWILTPGFTLSFNLLKGSVSGKRALNAMLACFASAVSHWLRIRSDARRSVYKSSKGWYDTSCHSPFRRGRQKALSVWSRHSFRVWSHFCLQPRVEDMRSLFRDMGSWMEGTAAPVSPPSQSFIKSPIFLTACVFVPAPEQKGEQEALLLQMRDSISRLVCVMETRVQTA